MLPQFGFTEFLMVAIVALIVVGPRDLPMMMRRLGQFVARGRAMANEFRSAFDDIARQTELEDLRKGIEDLKRDNALTAAVDDLKSVEKDINESVMREERAMAEELKKPAEPQSESEPSPAPDAEGKPAT